MGDAMTPADKLRAYTEEAADDLRALASYADLKTLLDTAKDDRRDHYSRLGEGSLAALIVDVVADALGAADRLIERAAPAMAAERLRTEAEDAEADAALEAMNTEEAA